MTIKFNLELNHPFWDLTNHVASHSKEFMKAHGLSYFQYTRCFKNGSVMAFLNTSEIFKTLMDHSVPILSSFEEDQHDKRLSYYFFWDEALPSFPVSLVREKLGMFHGMTIVKRYPDYYDMIAFAMNRSRRDAMGYYLNHFKSFERFAESFITTRKDLISIHEKAIIHYPFYLQDPNRSRICLKDRSQRFSIQGKMGPSYLTSKELFCLQLFNEGKSYKEISDRLSISTRTIETYFDRIKQRTGYSDREKLLDVLASCS